MEDTNLELKLTKRGLTVFAIALVALIYAIIWIMAKFCEWITSHDAAQQHTIVTAITTGFLCFAAGAIVQRIAQHQEVKRQAEAMRQILDQQRMDHLDEIHTIKKKWAETFIPAAYRVGVKEAHDKSKGINK